MIRLPSNHAAITAPLVASNASFPGIPIGRSLLDGRPFHLSPVLVDDRLLPSTNSLALGGLGSGKSTTAKIRQRREILDHGHQTVVIDSFGEETTKGEWSLLTLERGGKIIKAGPGGFALNPCSTLFPSEVREQLVRSLIVAVEPAALTPQATHALQHALNHPKATSLTGLLDALVHPEDGMWPAEKLTEWGEGVAIALSRFTEGSLRGLFDGQDASLPPTDLPILSFDFTELDRNSPAIPALMAAVACWVEHVWLPQSTAVHRHLVLEEAWQILLSPATARLIQQLLKNSRKANLSLDVVMHTLSDLGDGPAQDLAKLCEVAHIGRLNPEEAAVVGALLGLPAWAVERIPKLGQGEAVWKVGPDYVDIVKTVISAEEAELTDTSSRRRKARQALAVEQEAAETDADTAPMVVEQELDEDQDNAMPAFLEQQLDDTSLVDELEDEDGAAAWDWEMPPNVIDRHQEVVQAAIEGRCSEAAQLAAIGEREDINAYGINSDQAVSWLVTRARVAELCGSPDQAVQLRATVTRMGKDVEWYEKIPDRSTDNTASVPPARSSGHQPPSSPPAAETGSDDTAQAAQPRRRTWPYVATIAALALTAAVVWKGTELQQDRQEHQAKAAAYEGRSGAALTIDGVKAKVVARWVGEGRVIVQLRSYFDPNARFLRIDAGERSASSQKQDGWYPKDPEIELPVSDPLADVTVRVSIGGKTWKEGVRPYHRTVRLSPTDVAFDAETGQRLPSDL
ncbi:hypothetical protein ACFWII_37315 [Streptomyces sp. NPDC127063]|uniref:hypothetical protein n=1 Tax=Streptomyces sp. NPDC127063 TaxID=3347123 RepID=UPI00365358E0